MLSLIAARFMVMLEAVQYTFTTFMADFITFVQKIIGGWTEVITAILDQANFILVIPIFVYVFVVATASLRSFYKG